MNYIFKNLKKQNNKYDKDILTWRNQNHVREMMIRKTPITEEEHDNYLKKVYSTETYNIYIGFKDNTPFSIINIWEIEAKPETFEYGYYLINEKDLNSGLGILMEYFAIEKIFQKNKNRLIQLNTYKYNKKTISLHKGFGYKIVGEEDNLCRQELVYDDWIKFKDEIEKLINRFFNIDAKNII